MSTVDVTVEDGLAWDVDALVADAAAVLDRLGLSGAELSVLLVDDATIQPLNAHWRGRDAPTDVLSFSQLDGPPTGPDPVLGDVVISLETASRQAQERGHTAAHEVRVLLVHGVCHLIGHDHEQEDEAAEMESLERELLAHLAESG